MIKIYSVKNLNNTRTVSVYINHPYYNKSKYYISCPSGMYFRDTEEDAINYANILAKSHLNN